MKKSRFSEEQMVRILREAEATSVAAASKKHGVSEQTIYQWKKKFAGMSAADVKRLKELEQENARLKKLLAEAAECVNLRGESTSRTTQCVELDPPFPPAAS